MKKNLTIGAIVVSYNGINHLPKCLNSIKMQTIKVTEILVVNNGSTDGSKEFLDSQEGISVFQQENLGSSGGQFAGMMYFYKKKYDLIWCIDHDIVFNSDTLESLLTYAEEINYNFGFLSSCMLDNEGKVAYANIPELDSSPVILNEILLNKPISILSASFGSLLVKREVLDEVGLPIKNFFIYGDDAEFTLRIIKKGLRGYLVMQSKAIHNQSNSYESVFISANPKSKQLQYGLRNMTYAHIMRNEIVYHSRFRGYLSAIMYVLRIVKAHNKKKGLFDLYYLVNAGNAFIKGLLLHPKITFPKDLN